MRALVQRVINASVIIDQKEYSKIEKGLLIYLGVEKNDLEENANWLAKKIARLRIFADENEKMNLSAYDCDLEALVVSQFTLNANCQQGRRPDFLQSAEPTLALNLYEKFIKEMKKNLKSVKSGKFAAMMQVQSINDGPATFFIEKTND